jgi:hypothetical protein
MGLRSLQRVIPLYADSLVLGHQWKSSIWTYAVLKIPDKMGLR